VANTSRPIPASAGILSGPRIACDSVKSAICEITGVSDDSPVRVRASGLREVAGAICRRDDERSAAFGDQAAFEQMEGYATIREASTSSDGDRISVHRRGFLAAQRRCATATYASCSCVSPYSFMSRSAGIVNAVVGPNTP
jgi:hypothetical protein